MIFYVVVLVLLLVSAAADRRKTLEALKVALKKLKGILPQFAVMLILVSISLYLLPEGLIREYLGDRDPGRGLLIALLAGSITLMPGFIVFPLCGILHEKGVSYMILSGFTTTLMMVGIISFPVEKRYFGWKAALLRNLISFLAAVMVALTTGILFREISL